MFLSAGCPWGDWSPWAQRSKRRLQNHHHQRSAAVPGPATRLSISLFESYLSVYLTVIHLSV